MKLEKTDIVFFVINDWGDFAAECNCIKKKLLFYSDFPFFPFFLGHIHIIFDQFNMTIK